MKVNKRVDLITSEEMATEWIAKQRLRHKHPELFGLKSTGLKTLDEILGGGLELGQLVYAGGKEKSGKTTLLTTMAQAFAQQEMNYAMLSAEMTNMQMGNMIFSNIADIERTLIRSIKLDTIHWQKIEEAGKKISKFTGFWGYGFSTVEDIVAVIDHIEKVTEKPVDAILLDYIQLMEVEKVKMNRVQEIEYISRSLKRITIDRGKPTLVVAATQLNRESIRSKLYDAQAFLGSGALERDMDLGMIVHDIDSPLTIDKVKTNKKRISIVGSRETKSDTVDVYYDGSKARMADLYTGDAIDLYQKYWEKGNL